MSSDTKSPESQLALPEKKLSEQESAAHNKWLKTKSAHLPLENALKLYELYLNGYSTYEIYRINGGRIPFGAIVDAKVIYEWDQRKEAQLLSLYGNIEEKILKTKHDAIIHISDTLAAAHKIWGDKLKLFLQEGDASTLEGLDLTNMKTYKELISMLQMLTSSTGKDTNKKVQVQVEHHHTIDKPKNSQGAFDLLKSVEGEIIE